MYIECFFIRTRQYYHYHLSQGFSIFSVYHYFQFPFRHKLIFPFLSVESLSYYYSSTHSFFYLTISFFYLFVCLSVSLNLRLNLFPLKLPPLICAFFSSLSFIYSTFVMVLLSFLNWKHLTLLHVRLFSFRNHFFMS